MQEKLQKAEELKTKISSIKRNLEDFEKIKETPVNGVVYSIGGITINGSCVSSVFSDIEENNIRREYININIESEIAKEIRDDVKRLLKNLLEKFEKELESLEI